MKKSIYKVSKMDCSAEEQLVRMKLESLHNIQGLQFDLSKRELTVLHEGETEKITTELDSLKLDSQLISTDATDEVIALGPAIESRLLWIVLLINFFLFLIEIVTGFFSNSMGLVADSLDMLADALVYGLSLYAVGKLVQTKKRVASISGYLQLCLAILGFIEVLRRFLSSEPVPAFKTMILISILALIGNAISLLILQKSKSEEAHIKASLIFTSNDVLVNVGVIVAGILVFVFSSKYPDLIVGSFVFILVARGAFRILKLAK